MSLGEGVPRLGVEYRADGGVAVVKVAGEIDVFTCGQLRESLLEALAGGRGPGGQGPSGSGRSVVVNMAGVSFLDSTGTGALVGAMHRVRSAGGMMAVAAPSRQVRGILAVTGLNTFLPVYDAEADAVHACQALAAGDSPPEHSHPGSG